MSELKLWLEKDGAIGWIIFNQPEKRNVAALLAPDQGAQPTAGSLRCGCQQRLTPNV